MKCILASASPRRLALLREAGFEFDVIPSGAEEKISPVATAAENAVRLALEKAGAVASAHPHRPVIGADTLVALDGKIIGKPADEREAGRMLGALAGREHEVITGVAIVHLVRGVRWSGVAVSRVRFGEITPEKIAAYVAGGEPLDKAGAYAIQGEAAGWIENYEGSFSNIVGLPMQTLTEAMVALGYLSGADRAPCR